ncbi:MAG TPA: response regulator [Candidatus Paceibacterota bacterium]
MAEQKKYKVLIVDDDEFLLNMYSIKFAKSGLEVATSSSSDDALKKLREGFSPDAMVLDIVMPGMDGFELLEEIIAEKLASRSVVIFLTNQGQSADIERAKKLGANGYIVKASTIPSEVFNEVVRCIEREGKKG